MKRRHTQGYDTSPMGAAGIAMANPPGYGTDACATTCSEVRNSNPAGVRESNRVSQYILRIVAILTVIIFTSHTALAGALKYVGSTPENNGYISSFDDIVLSFDLTEVIAENGEANWGICANARYNSKKPDQQKTGQWHSSVAGELSKQPA